MNLPSFGNLPGFGRKQAATPARALPAAELINAAVQLAGTLAQENAALVALDLGRAADMVFDKARVLTAFEEACRQMSGRRITDDGQRHTAVILSERLQGLALDNKRLLERGMFVQKRVLALFARAAVGSDPSQYGTQTGMARRTRAIAVSSKA